MSDPKRIHIQGGQGDAGILIEIGCRPRNYYEQDAEELLSGLRRHLPGGTYEALRRRMKDLGHLQADASENAKLHGTTLERQMPHLCQLIVAHLTRLQEGCPADGSRENLAACLLSLLKLAQLAGVSLYDATRSKLDEQMETT